MTGLPRIAPRFPESEAPSIPTGCLSLDWALGAGGFPRGCLIEIFGLPDSGKTTVALEALAATQRAGGTGAFLDAEHALDPGWAATLGVRTEALIYATPTATAEAFAMITTLVRTCAVDLLVLDSVAALGASARPAGSTATASGNGDLDSKSLALGLQTLLPVLPKSPCCLLFLNQERAKLAAGCGNDYRTPGHPALPSAADIRIRMERQATLLSAGQAIGSRVSLQVLKSHLQATPREAVLEIHAQGGISREADLLVLGQRAGLIQKNAVGLWAGADFLGANPEEARSALVRNPARGEALYGTLRSRAGFPASSPELPLAALSASAGR